jgi:hypothetical protein
MPEHALTADELAAMEGDMKHYVNLLPVADGFELAEMFKRLLVALRTQPVSDAELAGFREAWQLRFAAVNETGTCEEERYLLGEDVDAASEYIAALERDNADLRARLRRFEEPDL